MKDFVQKLNWFGMQKKECFFAIDFNMQNNWVGTINDAFDQDILFTFPDFQNHNLGNENKKINIQTAPITFSKFNESYQNIISEINYGNSFLCNLTASTLIQCNENLKTIFINANAKYKVFFKNNWTCFSPETFIKINNNIIATYPMKGTINADLPNAEQLILNNQKEKAEHYTIVDLMRNDLNIVADNVQVEKFRYIDTLHTNNKNLLQVSSKITGELSANWQNNLGNIINNLLPAGSISGAPKQKTLEIIANAETHNRGYYTGIAGYFDGESLDTCVLIRFIENTPNGLVYKSGGGITCNSNVQDEYEELINKVYIPIAQ